MEQINQVRRSFAFKILQQITPTSDIETQLNAIELLKNFLLHQSVYEELTSPRCLELYQMHLGKSSNTYTKITIYSLFRQIFLTGFIIHKRINVKNLKDGEVTQEEERQNQEELEEIGNEFFKFIKGIIQSEIKEELHIESPQRDQNTV